MKSRPTMSTMDVLFFVAALIFVSTALIALLPKSPTKPPELPEIIRRIAGEIGGKYWWALAIGGLISILLDKQMLRRLVLSLLLAQIAIETLKFTIGEMRPDGRFFNSFPSGHTTSSFAFATVMSMRFRWGWIWFLFATVVGLSRIVSHAHWWHDVVGGAALGYIVAIGTCELLNSVQQRVTTISSVPEQPEHLCSSGQLENRENQIVGRDE
ncbi:MAG: phosphatase PAP2 family protein [Armatimonadota bacterium]|nr:phosphatase PAP2 family protein [Armatimonadota bacterium]MDW8142581.1 phosphatase PAP2 family protein [Armatimonadota bacterium]